MSDWPVGCTYDNLPPSNQRTSKVPGQQRHLTSSETGSEESEETDEISALCAVGEFLLDNVPSGNGQEEQVSGHVRFRPKSVAKALSPESSELSDAPDGTPIAITPTFAKYSSKRTTSTKVGKDAHKHSMQDTIPNNSKAGTVHGVPTPTKMPEHGKRGRPTVTGRANEPKTPTLSNKPNATPTMTKASSKSDDSPLPKSKLQKNYFIVSYRQQVQDKQNWPINSLHGLTVENLFTEVSARTSKPDLQVITFKLLSLMNGKVKYTRTYEVRKGDRERYRGMMEFFEQGMKEDKRKGIRQFQFDLWTEPERPDDNRMEEEDTGSDESEIEC